MTDVIYGSLPTPNDIKGTLATEEKMSGNLAAVFGKDGKSAYEVAVKNGFEGTETEWLASLQGEQGIQGIQGEQGDKGDKGDTGAQGIQGEKGDKGDKGDTGEQGIQGIQGKQGEKGDKGDPFTYSDFTSEQLASLKGEKGDKGDKGNTGEKGDTGNSGVYLGSGDMPDDCNVQIDPEGESLTLEQLIKKVIQTVNKISSVTLLVDQWEGEVSPYRQAVTISGATENSKIDLNPTVEQLNIFHNKDIAFVVENNNGATTVYCIGQKPTNDYTIQTTITEVAIDG